MVDEVEVKSEEVAKEPIADVSVDLVATTVVDDDGMEAADNTPHPVLSLLDKLEAKLFFVETAIATEIKQVIEEIKSHL